MRVTESVTWTPIAPRACPTQKTTVLISLDDTHGEPTWLGFHDGEGWIDVTGMPVDGVIGWANMPAGMR